MNKGNYTTRSKTWPNPSEKELEAFFCNPENFFVGMTIDDVFCAAGPFDSYFDCDRGILLYDWHRKTIRIRVVTQAENVTEVELLDPASTDYFDKPIQILWKRPKHTQKTKDDPTGNSL